MKQDRSENEKYTIASFFGGVGGIDLGFDGTNKFSSQYINEFDRNAQITISENFPDVNLDRRDIHDVKVNEVPNTDLVVGGFPCQAFSIAGYRRGFEDERGDLFFELLRIIKAKKPQAIFIENVKNMVTHDHGNTFKVIREALVMNGYFIKWQVLNAKDYGNIPQNRERIYIVGFLNKNVFEKFEFPERIELKKTLKDVIDFNGQLEDKYYYRKGKQPFYELLEDSVTSDEAVYQWRRQYVRENKSGVVPTLTANMGTGGHNVPIVKSKFGIRKLTPNETFKVQGFPDDFKLPKIANSQLYKQAGNSVVVPVIKRIADKMSKSLDDSEKNVLAPEISGKFAQIYVKMANKFSGQSYLVDTFDDYDDKEFDLALMSDTDYLKFVQKGKEMEFYSIEVV